MMNYKGLAVALMCFSQNALADDIIALRCSETDWQRTSAQFQENRDAVWQRMTAWLDRSAQVDCRAVSAPDAQFIWQCGEGVAQFEAALGFAPLPHDHQRPNQDWVFIANLVKAFSSAEMTEAFTQLEDDLSQIVEEMNDELEESGVTFTPTEPDPQPEEDTPEIDFFELIEASNPLRNSLGLTAKVSWSQAAKADELVLIDEALRVHALLMAMQRGDPSRGNTIAEAKTHRVRLADLTAQQAAFWSDAHLPLAASRFQLFDAPMDVVRFEGNGVAVVDIASWSQMSGLGGIAMEGVNEMAFFDAPQPEALKGVADGADCKALGTFPCPPLNRSAAPSAAGVAEVPASCSTADGCTFTVTNWVSDHVALRTHLQARNADKDDLTAFAARLPTLRTKALLTAFEPDPGFDATTMCGG